jgi:hypothetical protein
MQVQVLGADYSYVNAPTLSGFTYNGAPQSNWALGETVLDKVVNVWDKIMGNTDTPPPAVPSFMDQYGTYVIGGAAVVGVLVVLKTLKGKRRGRRR